MLVTPRIIFLDADFQLPESLGLASDCPDCFICRTALPFST